jgi:exodeoxyribonuclease V alpha subunit
MLGIPSEELMLEDYLTELVLEQKIVRKENEEERIIYPSPLYYMELNCARMLLDLNQEYPVEEQPVQNMLANIEKSEKIVLDELQREAVLAAQKHGLLVITGGPGTGKTTTINTMIRFFEQEGMDILLAAPTGRAAKRMSETTGYAASTIHRLLEVCGSPEDEDRGKSRFDRNEDNPLETDVLIIDEVSMVDIYLLHSLLKAVPVGTRLVLVGDVNQLPSVGPGNVLRDLIESGCCPVVRLIHIFRQAEESDIIVNAHKINRGEAISFENQSRDFFMVKRPGVREIMGAVYTLVTKKLPSYVKVRPYDIQILTPMRKGDLGVVRLNEVLQGILNPPGDGKAEKEFHDTVFREGDKVMQIKNDYKMEWEIRGNYGAVAENGCGIFNGDCGIIREINDFGQYFIIEFDENRRVEYPYSCLDELELAYAVTIHKSQGSEYPAVIIPVLSGPRMLMNRNLLYTAVTRAKNCVVIVGSSSMVQMMIDNVSEQKRYSSLAQRLEELSAM